MDAYVYQAALLCEECGKATRHKLGDEAGMRCPGCANALLSVGPVCPACGFDPEDEGGYDSDEYPKGPYPEGGGEADCPQHCDHCGTFLENALTSDGRAYTQEAVDAARCDPLGHGESVALTIWAPFYNMAGA